MTLEQYLAAGSENLPPERSRGVPSDWMPLGELEVTTGSLWAGDPYVANAEDGCTVRVPPGRYRIEAQGMDFGGTRVISRVRVVQEGARNITLGEEVGEAGTDTGMIGICDIEAMNAAIGEDSDAFQDEIMNQEYGTHGIIRFRMRGEIVMAYASSGFGDGYGPVFLIRSGSNPVGMELEFVRTDDVFEGA